MIYRGFSTYYNEWVVGYYARIQGKYLIIKPSGEQVEVRPDSLGRRTTKIDKEGNRIFEGDIIELMNVDGDKIRVTVRFGSVERTFDGHTVDIEGFYYETSYNFPSFPILFNYKGVTDYELFKVVDNTFGHYFYKI